MYFIETDQNQSLLHAPKATEPDTAWTHRFGQVRPFEKRLASIHNPPEDCSEENKEDTGHRKQCCPDVAE